jgi:hypothetical protein
MASANGSLPRAGARWISNVSILLDEMDNRVRKAYGSAPNAGYLIGRDGRVVVRHGWFHPPAMERSFQEHLAPDDGN